MNPDEVKALIEAGLPGFQVIVQGDGSHFDVTVIGEGFSGKSLLQKQKMVYATVNEQITSGAVHALTIKAYTPEEWEKAQKLKVI